MSEVTVDVSELVALGRDLSKAGDDLMGKVRPVVSRGALNVKNGMREDMQGSRHFGQVAASISYEMSGNAVTSQAEVGPVTEGQTVGDLAHFAYFGGANGGGGSVRDPQAVLDEEEPRFVKAIEDVVGSLL